MQFKFKIFWVTIFLFNLAGAVSSSEVNNNINELMQTIKSVNHDLNKKQLKQRSLDHAINDSGIAISKSEQLLNQLHERQILDKKQLVQIAKVLPILTTNTEMAESAVAILMQKVYVEIRVLESNSGSIISGNDEIDNKRKKMYLLKLLHQENSKYRMLQSQLEQLDVLNTKLGEEISAINVRLGNITEQKSHLEENLESRKIQAQTLKEQIDDEKQQLSGLRQKQAELNRLLAELNKNENGNNNNIDNSYEDHSTFLSRKLSRPISGDVIIAFNAKKNGTRNHGILFKGQNLSVYSISNGTVIYSGTLPGFGKILVINHGDNYVSIYGGIMPQVAKGDKVSRGEVIANSGNSNNQPMGGVYFELRHLGKPVNPNSLLE